MYTNELRIGNLINPVNYASGLHIPDTRLVLEVTEIHTFKIQTIRNGESAVSTEYTEYDITNVHPIWASEEWLLKFGFIKSNHYYESPCGVMTLQYFGTRLCLTTHQEDMLSSKITFVHQLQNLYFALTQNELKQIN